MRIPFDQLELARRHMPTDEDGFDREPLRVGERDDFGKKWVAFGLRGVFRDGFDGTMDHWERVK